MNLLQPRSRKISPKSVQALRAVHMDRRETTSAKLNAALMRMVSGKTFILKPGFRWSLQALAVEAEIHVNTLGSKLPDGTLTYRTAVNRLRSCAARREQAKEDIEQKRLNSLKAQLTEVIADRDKLIRQLDAMESNVITEREKARAAILDKEAMVKRLRDLGLLV